MSTVAVRTLRNFVDGAVSRGEHPTPSTPLINPGNR